jgi:hypothetical protein
MAGEPERQVVDQRFTGHDNAISMQTLISAAGQIHDPIVSPWRYPQPGNFKRGANTSVSPAKARR